MRLAIYASTIFGSALLLFAVQPMVGKALLPRLGGVPGAWTACLLFFQAALLVGYAYVWLGARWPVRVRVGVHVGMLALAALAVAPLGSLDGSLDGALGLSPTEAPVAYALAFLALEVGLAFTLLSATTPLLSSWYARAGGERPYGLYVASNAGSLGALLAYPFLVEPHLDLAAQAAAFRAGFAAVAIAIAIAGGVVVASSVGAPAALPGPRGRPTLRRRVRWAGLAFVPAALLAGATAHVSTDLAPIPLLWVLPLAIYLLSFIAAFSARVPAPSALVERAACLVATVLVVTTTSHANSPALLLAALHLAFLGVASWVAHRRLAEDAPHPDHLPELYVWMALGGVLGTLLSAVVAPLVLPDLWEYPAAIALACMARAEQGVVVPDRAWRQDLLHAGGLAALVVALRFAAPLVLDDPQHVQVASFAPAALYAYRWMPLRRRFTLCLLAIVVAAGLTHGLGGWQLTTRSFFGVLRVVDRDGERHLLHGTTLHGSQRLDQRDACVPMTYYVREGPLGAAFAAHRAAGRSGPIVAVGLGTGAIACYAVPDEPWRILEINADVVRIAQDPAWFTYLANAPSDRLDVVLADGRLGLEGQPDGALALVVLDAFNSDAVPVHLLTREAMRLYLAKLAPDGWAVLHLSNRVLDLRRAVAHVVAAEGAHAVLSDDEHATYVVVARDRAALAPLTAPRWRPLEGGDPRAAWTDAFSSLVDVLGDDPRHFVIRLFE
ncbi:MAG: hypothetical protein KF729_24210 [Sandaracinaceae bacterium]|nr:hypothetical protein [Sandaracinaceae bacterium]